MSSAILYLAIIAIWAGFLVPAWVRRPHTRSDDSAPEGELSYAAGAAEDESSGYLADTENDVGVGVSTDIHVEVSEYTQEEYEYYEVGYRGQEHVAAGYADQYETHPKYGDQEFGPSADAAEEPVTRGAGPGDRPGEADYDEDYGPEAHRPSQSREQMLHARRRMLAIVAGMTLVTMAFTALGLVRWWICIPPAGLLVLYVMLLREISMADADLARKRSAWEYARAVAYERHLQALADRQAYEASLAQPEPQAKIIDISGRVADADQLYDQYADAAVRAVGD